MLTGIIICHGELAAALQQALRQIYGPLEDLYALSNDGLEPAALAEQIRTLIPEGKPVLLFVDLRGGSCWRAARLVCRDYPEAALLSGVNLPMLVSFLGKRHNLPFAELLATLETDGKRGIVNEADAGK